MSMLTLLKNANLYAPAKMGIKDILLLGGKIAAIADKIQGLDAIDGLEIIDLEGKTAVPGLLDIHVHVTGGGGELGPYSRVRELMLSELTMCGITTVLGLLGTDGLTRSTENLVAKTNALNHDGITARCLTGSYAVPSVTLTGSVEKDIAFVDSIIGVKTAVSDHRSSNPDAKDLIALATKARMGGLVSGKAGIVIAHMGGGSEGLKPILEAVKASDLPKNVIIPTHCGRNDSLIREAAEYSAMGGYVDFTASHKLSAGKAVVKALGFGAKAESAIISSDSGGSLPKFNAEGKCIAMDVGSPKAMLLELKALVEDHNMPLEQALLFFTKNPAAAIGMAGEKGQIAKGFDGDILVLSQNFEVDTLFARGKIMVKDKAPTAFGMFEQVAD